MSTLSPTAVPATPVAAREVETTRSWKAPIAFAVFTVLAVVLFLVVRRSGTTTFRLANAGDFVQLPYVGLPSVGTGVVVVVLLALATAASFLLVSRFRPVPLWLTSVFAVLFVIGFLTWAAAGKTIPLPGLLVGAIGLSVPLVFGALGGVIS